MGTQFIAITACVCALEIIPQSPTNNGLNTHRKSFWHTTLHWWVRYQCPHTYVICRPSTIIIPNTHTHTHTKFNSDIRSMTVVHHNLFLAESHSKPGHTEGSLRCWHGPPPRRPPNSTRTIHKAVPWDVRTLLLYRRCRYFIHIQNTRARTRVCTAESTSAG